MKFKHIIVTKEMLNYVITQNLKLRKVINNVNSTTTMDMMNKVIYFQIQSLQI